ALILGEISHIFKDDDFWEQRYEQTELHASIQGAYGKDSNWQQRLRDVKKHDFEKAIVVIDKYYVKDIDYRKMLLGALKGFRLFLTTKHLDELFATQPDQSLALARLINRTDQKIDSLNKEPHITAGDLRRIYYQTISQNHPGLDIPEPILVDLFANQAFQALDDYTEMIWPDQQKWFSRTTTGSFSGIGVSIRINKAKQLEVFTPLVGTPAFKAGLQTSDLIVAVDGKTTKGITIDGAVRRITGKKGTTVILTIRRPGRPEEFDVPIVRDEIKISSVLGYSRLPDNTWNYIIDDREKIAYIRISNFMKNTAGQLDEAIDACRDQGARALILDLRFNHGGTLKASEEVSDRFLPRDKLIVSTHGDRVESSSAKTLRPDSCAGWPLVVLTSDGSASAAEIVAGALQD
ncbi:MAG: PDZ domain-containing protein, partial [Phycisphaerae bacterium]|nr:PDZ domain-containing protein [Phycisphaerae bacterium]